MCRVGPNDFGWPYRAGRKRSNVFWQISIITLERFGIERPNLAWWHRLQRRIFLGVMRILVLRCRGPSVPKIVGTPPYAQMVWSRATKFGKTKNYIESDEIWYGRYGNTRGAEVCFLGSATPPIPTGQGPSVSKFFLHRLPTPKQFDQEQANLVDNREVGACSIGGQPHSHLKGRGPSVSKFLGPQLTTYSDRIWCGNTYGARACFVGQPRPHLKGGPQRPQNFWDFLHARTHTMRKDNQILHGDQTRCEETFYTVDNECWRAICLR